MHHYTIRYNGEIGTKDKATRWKLINLLVRNIGKAIQTHFGKEISQASIIKGKWDITHVQCQEEITELLKTVAGISNFQKVLEHDYEGLEKMAEVASEHFLPIMKGKSFAVRCRREKGKYPIKSKDVEIAIGNKLYKDGKVNLTSPEVTCAIEVNPEKFFLSSKNYKGPGGFPVGSQGKALTLISGGFDSPVAAWKIYKNGIDQDFVYFDLGGDVQRNCIQASVQHLVRNYGHGTKGRLNMVNFLPVMKVILKAPTPFQNMILKYSFYQVASMLADDFQASALVTGESLGQVSTQTLKNLSVLDHQTPYLILRPVSTMDKNEIMAISRAIETHDLAYSGPELCSIAGKGVVTGTNSKKFAKALAEVKEELDQVLNMVAQQKETFDPFLWEQPKNIFTSIPEGYEVIDLREKDDQFPKIKSSDSQDFQKAMMEFHHWDRDKKYFLVCNVGSQSAILANAMKHEGFEVEHLTGGAQAL